MYISMAVLTQVLLISKAYLLVRTALTRLS